MSGQPPFTGRALTFESSARRPTAIQKGNPEMTSYTGQDGNTHVRFPNGDHYIVRGTHYAKVR